MCLLLIQYIPFFIPPPYIKFAICWQPNTSKPIVPTTENANTPKLTHTIKPLTTPEINLLIIFHLTLSYNFYFKIPSNILIIVPSPQPNMNQKSISQNIVFTHKIYNCFYNFVNRSFTINNIITLNQIKHFVICL